MAGFACLLATASMLLMPTTGSAHAATIRGHGIPQGHGGNGGNGGSGGHGGHSWHGGGGGYWGGYHHYLNGGFGFSTSYYYLPSYAPYGYYYAPYPGYYGPTYLPDIAYLDTDVSPENAEVILDGESVGIADDYDGFPRYLAVTPGRHTIEFRAPEHKTMIRNLRVPRGAVLDIEFTMPEGSGTVEPNGAKGDEELTVPEYRRGDDDRGGRQGDSIDRDKRYGREEAEPQGDVDDSEPGFVRLDVTPADASVYIDGRLYGSASRLSQLHGDLRLEVGSHKIEVVRPGYRSIARQINVAPGDHLKLDLELERSVTRSPAPR